MNKKLFVPAILCGLLLSGISFAKSFKVANADGTINFDVDAIQALSHNDGQTVNFVNSDIKAYSDGNPTDIEKLRTLYEMNDEIASFGDNAFDHEYTRDLYAKWDNFKPVNNTLTWKANVKANSFDVVVSLNAQLTEAVYEEKGLTEPSYTMVNPFSNTHYFWQVTAHTNDGDVKSSIFDFYSGDYKRTLDIPAISNTRDVGGFVGEYGYMKEGLIYRSARLDDITDESKAVLNQLDIQTDLDLRNPGEGAKNPANLAHYYPRTLQGYYNDFTEKNRAATIEAVRVFADPNNYPIMFHCAVGRDRTGTMGIILQALAGASKEYIIRDYYLSVFSVSGAYQKSVTNLNLDVLNDTFRAIESYGSSLNTGIINFLKQREDETTHELVGLTNEEIQAIRDIWSGKTPVEHGPKTFVAEDNYEGKAFVKIECLGHKDICMMVNKGSKVPQPYQLDESMRWYSNGELFSFAKPINDTVFIYADYVSQYYVTLHFVGIAKQDEILKLNQGDMVSINDYKVDGYNLLAVSDEGAPITSLTVTRDAYINLIYSLAK